MQHGLSDVTKRQAPHREPDDISADVGLDLLVKMVGERKRVLDLGCGEGQLAQLLSRRECDIVGFDSNPAAIEEARKYCTHAGVTNIDGAFLPELLGEQRFDVVVFNNVIQYLRQPTRLLDSARSVLTDGGYVVALIPNVSHGAIRLALLHGQFDGPDDAAGERAVQPYTAKTIDELFTSAGYRVEPLQRIRQPIFGATGRGTLIQREDFDSAIVAEVERDAESETLQFAIRALPLSNDEKHRAIAKRFIAANTKLSVLTARLEKREREIEFLNGATLRLANAEDELQRTNSALAELSSVSRSSAIEVDVRIPLIERAHNAELEVARLTERLAGQVREDPALRLEVEDANAQRDAAFAQLEEAKQQIATEYARATDEFNTKLRTIQESATKAEYDYAQRIVDTEIALAERQAEVEPVRIESERLAQALASAKNELSDVGIALIELTATLSEQRVECDTANAGLRDERARNEPLRLRVATLEEEVKSYTMLLAIADSEATTLNQKLEFLEARLHDDDARRNALNEMRERFAAQTQALLDQTRAEAERTELLIHTVQSGFFWKLKRLFRRAKSS